MCKNYNREHQSSYICVALKASCAVSSRSELDTGLRVVSNVTLLLVGVLQNKPAFSQAHQRFQTSASLTQEVQRLCND